MVMKLNPATGLMEDALEDNPILAGLSAPAPVVAPVTPVAPSAPEVEKPFFEPEAVTPLQPKINDVTSTSNAVKQQLQTPEEKRLQSEREKLNTAELGQAEKAAAAGKEKAIADAAQADEQQKIALEKNARSESLIAEGEARFNTAVVERETQYKALKAMKLTDYWADKTTGDKVLAGLAIALGGFGAHLSGDKNNRALDIINSTIDRDLQIQKGNIEAQMQLVGEADKGVAASKSQQEFLLSNVELLKKAAYENLGDKYLAAAKKRGIPEQQIMTDATYLALRQKQNDADIKSQEGLRKSVDSTTQRQVTSSLDPSLNAKAATETQGKARAFGLRMAEATKKYDKTGGISPVGADKIRDHISEVYTVSKDAGGILKYVLKPGAKPLPSGLSEKDTLAWGAIEDFSRANLRGESGAVIGSDEFRTELDQIMPTVTDTPAVIAAKRKLMTGKLAATVQQMGSQSKVNMPSEPAEQSPKTSESQGDVRMVAPNGREIVVPANKVKEAEANGAKRK